MMCTRVENSVKMQILGLVVGALLATSASATKSCPPGSLSQLLRGSFVNSLTLVSTATPGKEIVSNASVPQTLLCRPPNVSLTKSGINQSEQSNLIFMVYDTTATQLLWALSNVNLSNGNIISETDPKTTILKPYQNITIDPLKENHTLIFAIFEMLPNSSADAQVTVNQSSAASFSLDEWISKQIDSGVELCGPLAAAKIIVNNETQCPADNLPSTPPKVARSPSEITKTIADTSRVGVVKLTHDPEYKVDLMPSSFHGKNDPLLKRALTDSSKPASTDKKPTVRPAEAKMHYSKQSRHPNGNIVLRRVARAVTPAEDKPAKQPIAGQGETTTAKGETTTAKGETTTAKGETTTAKGETTTGGVPTTTGSGGAEITTAIQESAAGEQDSTTENQESTTRSQKTTTAKNASTSFKPDKNLILVILVTLSTLGINLASI